MAGNRLRVTEVEDEVEERRLKGKPPVKKAPQRKGRGSAPSSLHVVERMSPEEDSASVSPFVPPIVPTVRTQKVLDRKITTHQSQEVSTYTFKGEEIVRILIAHGYIPADGPTRTVFLWAVQPKGVSGRPLHHGDGSELVFESTRPLSTSEASKIADDWDGEDDEGEKDD